MKPRRGGHIIPMDRKYRIYDFWTALRQYLFLFFAASFIGYIWEVFLCSLKDGILYNRGFFYGPWLPVYGTGAVLLFFSLRFLAARPVCVFVLSLLLGGGVELAAGLLLDVCFGLRYWDYRGSMLNVNGYICLVSVMTFGLAGMLWVCFISRYLLSLWDRVLPGRQELILSLLSFFFMLDLAAACILPHVGLGITS